MVEAGLVAAVDGGWPGALLSSSFLSRAFLAKGLLLTALRADSAEYPRIEKGCRLFAEPHWATGVGLLLGGGVPGQGHPTAAAAGDRACLCVLGISGVCAGECEPLRYG